MDSIIENRDFCGPDPRPLQPDVKAVRCLELLELIKYFSIFCHPVAIEELYRFSPDQYSLDDIKEALLQLEAQGRVREVDNYYMLSGGNPDCVDKRVYGERLAQQLLPKAKRVARLISFFPFVKFVGISGSLSKYYADATTDYDFFIITANNTLWICRTILHVVKKFSFLVGRQHTLCMNYFLDEHHLRLAEKNRFVQIELSSMIPVHNRRLYSTLLLRNQSTLPNLQHLGVDFSQLMSYDLLRKNKENRFWRPLNLFFMKWTDFKWKRKWKRRGYPMEDYDLAMKTTPHVSKNHPGNYQKKVLGKLQNIR